MKIHMVKSGDTMYTIAQKYHVALDQLIAFNPQISDPNQIDVGMKVKIPKSTPPDPAGMEHAHKHTVVQGDSLWKISKNWGLPLKALVDANPQLKNPSVLLTGETVYIPTTSPIHQAMTSNSANMAAPSQLYPANPMLPFSANVPNVQLPVQLPQAAPPLVEQQAMPQQKPLEEKKAMPQPPVMEEQHVPKSPPVLEEQYTPKSPQVEEQHYMPKSPQVEEQHYMPMSPQVEEQQYIPKSPQAEEQQYIPKSPQIKEQQYMPMLPQVEEQQYMPKSPHVAEQQYMPTSPQWQAQQYMPNQEAQQYMPTSPQWQAQQYMPKQEAQQYMPTSPQWEAQQYMPTSPQWEAQQYMPNQEAQQYAQPFIPPMPQAFSPIQQANVPEQKKDSYNLYSSEHLFAQFNVPAVEAQGKPDNSYSAQLPAWDYGQMQMPQCPPYQPYPAAPTAVSPAYGSPKPDCGCGCGGTKQEHSMYYPNPAALPEMQQGYYPQTSPYYGSQPMQQPLPYPMSMQPQMQQPGPWDSAPAANMGMGDYPYTMPYTMPYAFPATHPASYMMPCYPMGTEMSYAPTMQLPYSMPYPYGNMPHENHEAGWDERVKMETPPSVQESETKQEVKTSRKSSTNRPAQPADDRAVIHEFLQRRGSAVPVKQNKSTSPWINY